MAAAIPEAMVQMRGSMVIAVALEGAAVMGEFGPGSLVGVMKLRRYFQIYRVLVPE
jgi:hypothetical protein